MTFQDECKNEGKIVQRVNITRSSLVLFFTLNTFLLLSTAPKAVKPKQEAQAAEGNG